MTETPISTTTIIPIDNDDSDALITKLCINGIDITLDHSLILPMGQRLIVECKTSNVGKCVEIKYEGNE